MNNHFNKTNNKDNKINENILERNININNKQNTSIDKKILIHTKIKVMSLIITITIIILTLRLINQEVTITVNTTILQISITKFII